MPLRHVNGPLNQHFGNCWFPYSRGILNGNAESYGWTTANLGNALQLSMYNSGDICVQLCHDNGPLRQHLRQVLIHIRTGHHKWQESYIWTTAKLGNALQLSVYNSGDICVQLRHDNGSFRQHLQQLLIHSRTGHQKWQWRIIYLDKCEIGQRTPTHFV